MIINLKFEDIENKMLEKNETPTKIKELNKLRKSLLEGPDPKDEYTI